MSTKKTSSRFFTTPEVRSKGVTQKSSSKQALNSTSVSKQSSNGSQSVRCNTVLNLLSDTKLNTTTASTSLVPETVAIDWNLQCELSSNEYYLALLTNQLTREKIQEYENAMDDQLSQQAELLKTELVQEQNLDQQIQDLKIKIEIEKQLVKFNELYEGIVDVLQSYNVEENLDTCIDSFEIACNKLYLKNIQPFQSQEDYNKFSELIEKCNYKVEELKKLIKNIELVNELAEEMGKFVELRGLLIKKQKNISDLQNYINSIMYKVFSDKLASN